MILGNDPWGTLEQLLKEARIAFYADNKQRLVSLLYLLKLGIEDIEHGSRSDRCNIVHSSELEEV